MLGYEYVSNVNVLEVIHVILIFCWEIRKIPFLNFLRSQLKS